MTHPLGNTPFPLLRSTLLLCAVATVGVVLVAVAAPHLVLEAVAAAGACVVGGFIGLLPVWRLARVRLDGAGVGYMLGLVPRAMVAFAAALFIRRATNWDMPTFAALLIAFYLVTLVAEVYALGRHLAAGRTAALEPVL